MDLTGDLNIQLIVNIVSDLEYRAKLIKQLKQLSTENAKVLIFIGTKQVANDIIEHLHEDSWPVLAMHGYT